MADIHMIGTSHVDPFGEEKLYTLLHKIAPERVLLEVTKDHHSEQELYVQILREELLRHRVDTVLASILLKEQEVRGYETRAARRYCESISFPEPEHLLDYSDVDPDVRNTPQKLRQMVIDSISSATERFTPESAALYAEFANIVVEGFYQQFRGFVGAPYEANVWFALPREGIGEKDRIMERRLRDAVEREQGKRIATVTGLKHILLDPQGETLYSRVHDLNPKRYVL